MILVRSRGFSDKHYMDAHVCTNISDAKVLNVVCHKLFKHEKGPSILEPYGGLVLLSRKTLLNLNLLLLASYPNPRN